VWQPRPDFEIATEGWLTAGGPHHTVLTTALGADELTDLGEVFSTELVLIDTRRSLLKELRWSAAYHRLAQPI
jgi:L-arabinose isomerase